MGFSFDKENYCFCLETSSPGVLSVEVLLLFILTMFGSRAAFLCVSSASLSGDCCIVLPRTLKSPKTKFILQIQSLLFSLFLSRRLLLVFNGLLGAWSYLFTYYPVSVFWTCNPGKGKADEPLGPSVLGLICGEESKSRGREMG